MSSTSNSRNVQSTVRRTTTQVQATGNDGSALERMNETLRQEKATISATLERERSQWIAEQHEYENRLFYSNAAVCLSCFCWCFLVPGIIFVAIGIGLAPEIQKWILTTNFAYKWEDRERGLIRRIYDLSARAEYRDNPQLIHNTTTYSALNANKTVMAMTVLYDRIFVIHQGKAALEVYDSTTFSLLGRLPVRSKLALPFYNFIRGISTTLQENLEHRFIWPCDIASSERDKCIYVFDGGHTNSYGMFYKIDYNGVIVTTWETAHSKGHIVVTYDFNIILVADDMLIEYTSDGLLIRKIQLQRSTAIVHAVVASKLPSGDYIILGVNEFSEIRFVQADIDGNLIRLLAQQTEALNSLASPSYFCVDKSGVILVGDFMHRISLTNSALGFPKELMSLHGKVQGNFVYIYLHEISGRLFLLLRDSKNEGITQYGRILVYSVK